MNLEEIADNVRAEAEKLQQGDKQEQELGKELAAVAEKIEVYRKEKNARSLDSGNVKQGIEDLKASAPNRPPRQWSEKRHWPGRH